MVISVWCGKEGDANTQLGFHGSMGVSLAIQGRESLKDLWGPGASQSMCLNYTHGLLILCVVRLPIHPVRPPSNSLSFLIIPPWSRFCLLDLAGFTHLHHCQPGPEPVSCLRRLPSSLLVGQSATCCVSLPKLTLLTPIIWSWWLPFALMAVTKVLGFGWRLSQFLVQPTQPLPGSLCSSHVGLLSDPWTGHVLSLYRPFAHALPYL